MENLKQMRHDFAAYMLARDFTPEAQLTPEIERMLRAAAAIAAGVIVLIFIA